MWEYLVQKDGKVRRFPESKLRKKLSSKVFNGLELARRADDPTWRPLCQLPIYNEEVPFVGDPMVAARVRLVRGFAIHFIVYIAVNAALGFPSFVLAVWAIGLITHGMKALPHAKALNDAGLLPLVGSIGSERKALPPQGMPPQGMPPQGMPPTGTTTQPPIDAPRAALPAAPPHAPTSYVATSPSATSDTASASTQNIGIGLDPTLGISPPAGTDLEHRQLQASVRNKLFGDEASIPIEIGRYRLGERLGAGGMGIVYEAQDTTLDRPVALKLLRPGYVADAASERLQREARAMARLCHPNVVTVFDVGTFEGAVFVAMERVDGVTLRQWLNEPRLTADVIDMIGQAAEGLAAAHVAGLVHRDFKPENVMVGTDGRVRVLDFGLAKPTDPQSTQDLLTQTGTTLGTPRYMAPEQFRGEVADARSDQFSLGVVLYEALYGLHPYQPNSDRPLPRAVMAGELRDTPARADVPSPVRESVLRAVAHDPELRHESLRAFASALGPRPATSDQLASIAAAARRLLARRPPDEAKPLLTTLDAIERSVSDLDLRVATLSKVSGAAVVEQQLADAQMALEQAQDETTRTLLMEKVDALQQRLEGVRSAQQMIERLRTRRSIAQTQLEQLHLDLVRAQTSDTELPDLTGPLSDLRHQVDAALEVEALLR